MCQIIDKKTKVPLHYQVYLDILKKIQTGELLPGEKIPSERQLEKIYGVSRITVRSAIEMLSLEGLVEKNRGKKGTVVSRSKHTYDIRKLTSFTDDVQLYGESAGSELLDFQVLKPKREIAHHLNLSQDETVYYIERKRYRQKVAVGLHKAYIKKIPGLLLQAEQFYAEASLYEILRENGIIPTTAMEIIDVKIPSERILSLLDLPPKTAVFHKKRVTYSSSSTPFEYVEMYYNPEDYQYKIELRLD